MFARKLLVLYTGASGLPPKLCPVKWIDNFAMRNFTNDAIFDDTLPIGDGLLEVGYRVPLDQLEVSMSEWFRRKSYLKPGERLVLREQGAVGAEHIVILNEAEGLRLSPPNLCDDEP